MEGNKGKTYFQSNNSTNRNHEILKVYIENTYHAAHGMHTTLVAGPDEELRIAFHEVLSHADKNPVR